MYSSRSSGFVGSGSFPISDLSLFCISFACVLLVLNSIFWYFILYDSGYLVNHILPSFQSTSGLCLTNQLCPQNISVSFKSITAASKVSLYLLISTSSSAILVTSLFLVLFALNTSKKKSTGFVYILLSLISTHNFSISGLNFYLYI